MPSPTVLRNIIRASSLHPDTRDYRDRIFAAGSSIDGADTQAIDRLLVRPMHNTGLRQQYVVDCGLFAGNSLAGAAVKLWYPSGSSSTLTLTNFVEGDFLRTGLKGNASNKSALTGLNPSTLLSAANCHIAVGCTDFETGATFHALSALFSGGLLELRNFNGNREFFANSSGASPVSAANTATKGLFLGNALSTTDLRLFLDDSQVGATQTAARTNPLPSGDLPLFFRAGTGTGGYTAARIYFYSVGLGIPVNLQPEYYRIFQQTMTYFGRAV